jgi:hypothetical protein
VWTLVRASLEHIEVAWGHIVDAQVQEDEMTFRDEIFTGERIDLHGKAFQNCTFKECELVFDGDRPPTMSDNHYEDSVFVLTDAAARTLYLLSNIYHAGDGGRQVIERLFSDVRERRIHGHEIRSSVPNTADHSLS